MVLDGCPRSPKRTWDENGFFKCFHFVLRGFLLLAAVFWPRCRSVGRGCAPSFSAHVRWGEHGAPVQGRGPRSLLQLQPTDEPRLGCFYNLILPKLQRQGQAVTALSRSFAASRGYCGSVILTGSRISAISSSVSCFRARAISIIDFPVATDSFTISAALAYPM
jgi:hypothetical protein